MIGTLFTEVQRGFVEVVGIHTIMIGGPVTILSLLDKLLSIQYPENSNLYTQKLPN